MNILEAAEFQLIMHKDGYLVGRLFHPSRKFNVENSKREILDAAYGGRCIYFTTEPEDFLAIAKIARESNVASCRVKTRTLLQTLRQPQPEPQVCHILALPAAA